MGNERLIIKHKDVNVKLHQNCGFKHQCYNDLYTCKLDKSEEMVTIDHGEPDWITIEGENGQGTDYCPFNPLKDMGGKVDFANGFYGIEHVAESSQSSGACRISSEAQTATTCGPRSPSTAAARARAARAK